jgi:hypothetical protein
LHKDEAFCVLKRLLNFAPHKIESARRKHNAFLDYYLPDSTLECHRGHLLVDDYFVKVLTLKEPSSQSFALIFKQMLEVEASFILCTEWHLEDTRQDPEEHSKPTAALPQLQDVHLQPTGTTGGFQTQR